MSISTPKMTTSRRKRQILLQEGEGGGSSFAKLAAEATSSHLRQARSDTLSLSPGSNTILQSSAQIEAQVSITGPNDSAPSLLHTDVEIESMKEQCASHEQRIRKSLGSIMEDGTTDKDRLAAVQDVQASLVERNAITQKLLTKLESRLCKQVCSLLCRIHTTTTTTTDRKRTSPSRQTPSSHLRPPCRQDKRTSPKADQLS